jgi:4-hydroxybenzoate polyprenyltransferase
LVYARKADDPQMALLALGATLSFCLISSSVYLFNDLRDIQADREHPEKRNRPLASGRLSPWSAKLGASLILLTGLGLAAAVNQDFLLIVLAYLVQNFFYTLWLKRVVLVDVFLISNGFVLRAAGGALALQVQLSEWLLLCTITLSLFLGFAKRRAELLELGGDAKKHRKNLQDYNLEFLDQMISISASTTVLAYALSTRSPEVVERVGTANLIYTTPFVFYGIFRYLYLLHVKRWGPDPARALLNDRPLLITCLIWAAVSLLIIYPT